LLVIKPMKLPETLLLSAAFGSLIVWVLELRRTSFLDSYWLLMAATALLFGFLYMRQRRILGEKNTRTNAPAKPKPTKPVAALTKSRKKK
jgi:hypothetical protein